MLRLLLGAGLAAEAAALSLAGNGVPLQQVVATILLLGANVGGGSLVLIEDDPGGLLLSISVTAAGGGTIPLEEVLLVLGLLLLHPPAGGRDVEAATLRAAVSLERKTLAQLPPLRLRGGEEDADVGTLALRDVDLRGGALEDLCGLVLSLPLALLLGLSSIRWDK